MTHVPTKLDIVADLRRSIYASFDKKEFGGDNVKTFIKKAEENLNLLNGEIDSSNLLIITDRIEKAKDSKRPLEKRREDLLLASNLI